jgi:iron(III) transport system substrate-binding protein
MDLQMRLASDGYALQYKSVEASKIPGWAMWDDKAYGTTFEPAAIVYNKRLVDAKEVPQTHADFTALIQQPKFKDKVTTYDIEKSGVGFMFMTQDAREIEIPRHGKRLRRGQGARAVVHRHHDGAYLVGRKPDRLQRAGLLRTGARQDRSVDRRGAAEGLHAGDVARVLHQQGAKNVNAAKLWLDYMLSHRGQTIIANDSKLFAIRADVTGETTSAELIKQIGNDKIKPVPVHPILLQFLGPAKRMAFLKQWKETAGKSKRHLLCKHSLRPAGHASINWPRGVVVTLAACAIFLPLFLIFYQAF